MQPLLYLYSEKSGNASANMNFIIDVYPNYEYVRQADVYSPNIPFCSITFHINYCFDIIVLRWLWLSRRTKGDYIWLMTMCGSGPLVTVLEWGELVLFYIALLFPLGTYWRLLCFWALYAYFLCWKIFCGMLDKFRFTCIIFVDRWMKPSTKERGTKHLSSGLWKNGINGNRP